jgi:hypothetical protein
MQLHTLTASKASARQTQHRNQDKERLSSSVITPCCAQMPGLRSRFWSGVTLAIGPAVRQENDTRVATSRIHPTPLVAVVFDFDTPYSENLLRH